MDVTLWLAASAVLLASLVAARIDRARSRRRRIAARLSLLVDNGGAPRYKLPHLRAQWGETQALTAATSWRWQPGNPRLFRQAAKI